MERRNSFRRSIYTAVDEDETRNNSLLHYKSKTHIINGKHPRPPPNPTPFIVGNCGIPNAFMKNDDRRFFDWNCSSAVFFSLLLAEKSGIGVLLFDTWTKKKKMSGSTTRGPIHTSGFHRYALKDRKTTLNQASETIRVPWRREYFCRDWKPGTQDGTAVPAAQSE